MATQLTLNFQNKDLAVQGNSNLIIGSIIVILIAWIFIRSIWVLPIIVLLIILEIINLKTVHGLLSFSIREEALYFQGPEDIMMEAIPVEEIRFRWEYAGIDQGVESLNKLYAIMETKRGIILITQELYPWEVLHADWEYEILRTVPQVDYRVDKGLTDLKTMVEKRKL